MQVPLMSKMSAGTVVSVWCRAKIRLVKLIIVMEEDRLTDGNYISWKEFIGLNCYPFPAAHTLDRERGNCHSTELAQGFQSLARKN